MDREQLALRLTLFITKGPFCDASYFDLCIQRQSDIGMLYVHMMHMSAPNVVYVCAT